jgi:hypothetical protein
MLACDFWAHSLNEAENGATADLPSFFAYFLLLRLTASISQ